MAEIYKIGNYQCSSKEEYMAMCSDINKIKILREKYDCKNPDVARKLLDYFENKPDAFVSVLGQRFKAGLKQVIEENKPEKYIDDISEIPETIQSIDGKRRATVTVTTEQEVKAKIEKPVEDTEKIVEEYIPLDIPVYKPRNIRYAIIFSLFMGMFPVVTQYDILTKDAASNCAIVFAVLCFWFICIGFSEFSRINKISKEVQRIKQELEREKNAGAGDDSGWKELLIGIGVVLLIVVVCVACPPVLLILLFVRACMAAAPKLKWLATHWKYFFSGLFLGGVVFVAYMLAFLGAAETGEIAEKMSPYPGWLQGIVFFIVSFLCLLGLMRRKIYQTIRTVAAIPVMIFMILLPFAMVGLAAYAMYSEDSSASGAECVGVHEVEGHLRHLSNGSVVYVRPHLRTNPDGILTNNFSYNG